ncbi:MAG TPA: nucleotidyltransferase domain-containing protein [Sphingobium sp.]
MTREEAIARIKPHEGELRAGGMAALYLFGSTARNEANAQSDIDLMCELDPARRIGLIAFAGMLLKMEELMGSQVDLVERQSMRPRILARAETDMVQVF